MADHKHVVRTALLAVRRPGILLLTFLLIGCGRQERSPLILPLRETALQEIFRGLYEASALPERGPTPAIPVLIVPHHLTASVTIAAGISALVPQKPDSVILLSPDHFDDCPNLLCTGDTRFDTPLGTADPDDAILRILHESPLVTERTTLFPREHGITALVPFFAELLPGTRVTPLVISVGPQWKGHREELFSFVQSISKNSVLVISSDFSHYLGLLEADKADEETAKILFSKNIAGLTSLENPAQSDCPPCIWLAARVAEERDAYNPSVLLRTNSARLLGDLRAPSTTSHFAIAFYNSAELDDDDIAFAGDVTLTRSRTGDNVLPPKDIREFWKGDGPRIVNLEGPLRNECSHHPNPYIFCNPLVRFLTMNNLATHWSMENNHMLDQGNAGYEETEVMLREHGEISLSVTETSVGDWKIFALTNVMNPLPEGTANDPSSDYRQVIDALQSGKDSPAAQIVYVHAGTEFAALSTEREETYLRSFVDAGADAVLSVHTHVPGDMEIYKGAPIFRGLGNFIFDQKDPVPTSTAKVVRLRRKGRNILFETRMGK